MIHDQWSELIRIRKKKKRPNPTIMGIWTKINGRYLSQTSLMHVIKTGDESASRCLFSFLNKEITFTVYVEMSFISRMRMHGWVTKAEKGSSKPCDGEPRRARNNQSTRVITALIEAYTGAPTLSQRPSLTASSRRKRPPREKGKSIINVTGQDMFASVKLIFTIW